MTVTGLPDEVSPDGVAAPGGPAISLTWLGSPWAVAALALLARAVFGVVYWGQDVWLTGPAFAAAQGGDPSKYAGIVANILAGDGFTFEGRPTARVGPMLPYVMAGVFKLVGTSFWSLLVANGVFGAAAAFAVWRIATALYGDVRIAALAGVFVALNPGLLHWSAMLMTQGLCIALLTWGVLQLVEFVRTGRTFRMAAGGILLALAALTRAEVLLTALLIPFAMWLGGRRAEPQGLGRSTLAFVAAAVLTLAPWTVRNYLVFGALLPVTSSSGVVFLHGNGPQYAGVGIWDPQVWRLPPEGALTALGRTDLVTGGSPAPAAEDEVTQRGRAWRIALRYLAEHPGEYLKRCLGRLLTLWLPWTPVMSPLHRVAKGSLWVAVVPTGFWALWRSRHLALAGPVTVPIVGTTLVLTGLLLDPALAYRTPAEAFLAVFAAAGWILVWERIRWRVVARAEDSRSTAVGTR